jgi:hypothetical protein
MVCLGLHNKPKAEVHPGHKLTGQEEEEGGGGGGGGGGGQSVRQQIELISTLSHGNEFQLYCQFRQ